MLKLPGFCAIHPLPKTPILAHRSVTNDPRFYKKIVTDSPLMSRLALVGAPPSLLHLSSPLTGLPPGL